TRNSKLTTLFQFPPGRPDLPRLRAGDDREAPHRSRRAADSSGTADRFDCGGSIRRAWGRYFDLETRTSKLEARNSKLLTGCVRFARLPPDRIDRPSAATEPATARGHKIRGSQENANMKGAFHTARAAQRSTAHAASVAAAPDRTVRSPAGPEEPQCTRPAA